MKKTRVVLDILSVISFVFGALYCFTLVFIPVGVYCFSAGKLFSSKADHLLDNYSTDKKTMVRYFIFIAIVCFPLGLLSILAHAFLYGNNVKVDNFNYVKITTVEPEEKEETKDNSDEKQESKEEQTAEEPAKEEQTETEEEKLEKLAKLENFKEKGIITEEEFEMAREQMFGKKDE